MAGISDLLAALSKPGDWLSEHPGTEEILGALPAIAGAYLLSRPYNSRIGTPLGAALGTAGGLVAARGYKDSEALAKRKEDAAARAAQVSGLQTAFPSTGPPAPMSSALPTLVGSGFTPSEAIDVTKQFEPPKVSKFEKVEIPGKQLGKFDPTTGTYSDVAGGPTIPAKTERETDAQFFQRDPNGYRAYKAAARVPKDPSLTPISPKDFVKGPNDQVGVWLRNTKGGTPTFQVVPGATVTAGKPLIRKLGDSLVKLDPDNFNVIGKIDAPAKVKDKTEWSSFADGYVKDHPEANGVEITGAYEKMKKGGSMSEFALYRGAHPDEPIDDSIKNFSALKRPAPATKPPQLPTELKSVYSLAPAPSMAGAWVLTPAPNAIYPSSGVLGTSLGGKKAPPLLYIPGKGYVAPGKPIPGTKIIWDGNP